MNVKDPPATEQQLSCLRQFGYVPENVLSKTEATELIRSLRQQLEASATAGPAPIVRQSFHLRTIVENAKHALAEADSDEVEDLRADMESAMASRREFWMDTCREITQMRVGTPEALELYKDHGCRFQWPNAEQTQEVLDALDSAMPDWDRNHPELFYQTLELNFPELVRRA